MGTVTILPIDSAFAQKGGRFQFTTTIVGVSYSFDFRHIGVDDWWYLIIVNTSTNAAVFQSKVVYGNVYSIDKVFALTFYDFQEVETELTMANIGSSVQGLVAELA